MKPLQVVPTPILLMSLSCVIIIYCYCKSNHSLPNLQVYFAYLAIEKFNNK